MGDWITPHIRKSAIGLQLTSAPKATPSKPQLWTANTSGRDGVIVINVDARRIRVLLVKEVRSGNWGFPKGIRIDGETALETAIRKLYEETGIRAPPRNLELVRTEGGGSMFAYRTNGPRPTTIAGRWIKKCKWFVWSDIKNIDTMSQFTVRLVWYIERKAISDAHITLLDNKQIASDNIFVLLARLH